MTYRLGHPCFTLLIASLLCTSAQATLIASVGTSGSNNTGEKEYTELSETLSDGKSVLVARTQVGDAHSTALIQAEQGLVRATITGGTQPGSDAYAGAGISARMNDLITLSRDDLNGQTGHVVFAFEHNVDLDVMAELGSRAAMGMSLSAGIITNQGFSMSWTSADYREDGLLGAPDTSLFADTGTSVGGTTPEAVTVRTATWVNRILLEADFVFGEEFYEWVEIALSGFTNSQSGAARLMPGGLSAFWFDGIQSVTAGGIDVSDYQVSSASGMDYTRSYGSGKPVKVPEPGSLALLLAGLFGLAWVRRAAF